MAVPIPAPPPNCLKIKIAAPIPPSVKIVLNDTMINEYRTLI